MDLNAKLELIQKFFIIHPEQMVELISSYRKWDVITLFIGTNSLHFQWFLDLSKPNQIIVSNLVLGFSVHIIPYLVVRYSYYGASIHQGQVLNGDTRIPPIFGKGNLGTWGDGSGCRNN